MNHREPFEDTWHDVICKAMRGLQLDISSLSGRCQLAESSIRSVIEQGIVEEHVLVAIAPALGLNGQALLAMALEPDSMSIPALPKNFHRFVSLYHGMEVNSYLFWSHENRRAIIFDTGTDITPILKELERSHLTLDAIFLTHGHSDHVDQLKNLMKATGASAWSDERETIPDTQWLSPYFQYHLDTIVTIEARATPGHSPGGTTYVIDGTSPMIAIVGDALFARSVGGISPSSYQEALRAIREKILCLPDETIIAPGHGPLTTVGIEKRNNPFFS